MLLSFKAKQCEELDLFLALFMNPSGTVSRICHLWLYGEKKLHKFDDGLVVIETNGFLESLGWYVFIMGIIIFIAGFLFHWFVFSYLVTIFTFLSLFFISSKYHSIQLVRDLKRFGYKDKVSTCNYWFARMRLNATRSSANSKKPI